MVMLPTTTALAEPLPLTMPIDSEPSTAACGTICRLRAGEPLHDVDHRALRAEAVGDRGQQQEGGDQGQRDLTVDAVDAGRKLDRARRDHAIERGPRMPEEVERAQISPQRVDDHHEVDPEQNRVGEARQLHHQQENEQADDEILRRPGALAVDRDLFKLTR